VTFNLFQLVGSPPQPQSSENGLDLQYLPASNHIILAHCHSPEGAVEEIPVSGVATGNKGTCATHFIERSRGR
jgi:hypothetical protein